MQEIEQFNQKLKSQRRTATFFVGSLVVAGLSLTLPLWNDSVKWEETLYCFQKTKRPCAVENFKRGVSWIVESERRNFLFNESIKIIRTLPPENNTAMLYGMLGTSALLAAWGVSKNLTNQQEEAIHSQFSMLKIKAIENDIIAGNHIDLTQFSKAQQSEITKSAIARHTSETIDQMKSPGELAMDEINGRLQGEIALKSHELNISELDKQIADNRLTTAEAIKKLEKVSKLVDTKDTDQVPANEQLKNSLIDALKNHEDGWLWYLVESFTAIIIHGKAGSYKSYTAAAIALLKHYLIDAKVESICDIDFDQNKNDSWKFLVPLEPSIYGQGIDWESYDEGFIAAIDRSRIRTLKDKPIVSIWDELTNAKGKFDNAQNVVPFVIATPRKRNEHCILISHNLTQDCLGGCTGMSEPIKTQTYRLNLKTTPQGKPLFKGILEGLVDNDGNELQEHKISLPGRLRPEIIYGHFNGKPIKFDEW